jgi:hypothetical protein
LTRPIEGDEHEEEQRLLSAASDLSDRSAAEARALSAISEHVLGENVDEAAERIVLAATILGDVNVASSELHFVSRAVLLAFEGGGLSAAAASGFAAYTARALSDYAIASLADPTALRRACRRIALAAERRHLTSAILVHRLELERLLREFSNLKP